MSTAEIVAVAAAAIVVLLLIVIVVARGRRRAAKEPGTAVRDEGSMFDRPPSDTLEKLGRAEKRGEAPDLSAAEEPRPEMASEPEEPAIAAATETAEGGPGPAQDVAAQATETPEAPPAEPVPEETPPEPEATEPPVEAAEPPAGETSEPAAPEAEGDLVPLSSIIVTTSNKIVDLDDPEIRRMLTDLVTFEIDQAEQFREQGQTIDAVLQLTEAEKICRALGKEDTAGEIRAMMRELQA